MLALVDRARTVKQSPHFKRTIKFASVSVVSTLISQSILYLTYRRFEIASAVTCNVIATMVATFPAYYLNRRWTWGKSGKSSLMKEVVPFWVMAFIGLVLSTVAVGITAHYANHIADKSTRDYLIQGANFVSYGLIWVARYSILNKYMFGKPATPKGNVVDTFATERPALDATR